MICVAISANDTESAINKSKIAIDEEATLIEVRIDHFEKPSEADFTALVKNIKSKLILTVRKPGEGGKFPFSESERIKLLQKSITANPYAIDLEACMQKEELNSLIKLAKQHNVKIILSSHDFKQTPSVDEMKKIILDAARKKVDYVKIINTAGCIEDNLKMLSLPQIAADNDIQIIAFAMGQKGTISRILSPIFGAAFTFASLDEPTAPGQIQIEAMKKNLETFTSYLLKEEC